MNIFDTVKRVPGTQYILKEDVCRFFDINYEYLTVYINNHRDELRKNGLVNLKVADFLNIGYTKIPRRHAIMTLGDFSISVPPRGVNVFTDDAMLHLASRLTTNEVAKKVMAEVEEVNSDDFSSLGALRLFTSSEFGKIRVLIIDDEPWLVGKDVARVLGYARPNEAINDHVHFGDKKPVPSKNICYAEGYSLKEYGTWVVNESGFYDLVFASKLPTAQSFRQWVTHDVLPTIRKHGVYMTNEAIENALTDPDFIIRIAQQLKDERARNAELTATNTALINERNTWEPKTIINALIRTYSANCCGNLFGKGWTEFYKQLRYKHSIDIPSRIARSKKIKSGLNLLKDDEAEIALGLAVAMCEQGGIDTGKILCHASA